MPIFASAASRQKRRKARFATLKAASLGEHAGVHHFTVGQRRGLRVAAGEPLYVIATEPASQRVIVGREEDLLRGHPHVPRT